LFAPESGEKLRRDLADRFSSLREDATSAAKAAGRRAGVSPA
jgi:gas vesicle protein